METFIKEIKIFSKNNWWIFILLIFALWIVAITGKWNLTEIIILFLANFLWNLFIMVMQTNYTNKNNKVWALYHISSTWAFTCISLYGIIFLGQSQYILWQLAYLIASIKAFSYYNFWKNITIFNEKTLVLVNTILLLIFLKFFNFQTFSLLQALWFSLITTGLVSIKDETRYWFNIIWIFLLVSGSLLWVIVSFQSWNTDWIALWYFLLTLTVFVYYIKLLKKYL
jgi:hypothetical protein